MKKMIMKGKNRQQREKIREKKKKLQVRA